ncbi:hypothetical protein Tco_0429170 [Tanacetum coccineum]
MRHFMAKNVDLRCAGAEVEKLKLSGRQCVQDYNGWDRVMLKVAYKALELPQELSWVPIISVSNLKIMFNWTKPLDHAVEGIHVEDKLRLLVKSPLKSWNGKSND